MAPWIVEGIYRDGRVELTERPEGVDDGARVRVAILPAEVDDATRREAGDRLMARLRQGIELGGPPYPKRDSLHDREDRPGAGAR